MAEDDRTLTHITAPGRPVQLELDLVRYTAPEARLDFALDASSETMWVSRSQIAALFKRGEAEIAALIRAVLTEGELEDEGNVALFPEGGPLAGETCYSLDMVLCVGYRIDARKATAFRRWATRTLRTYVVDGYALDRRRLSDDPRALAHLAAKLRALRAQDVNVYAAVRECMEAGASDFDRSSPAYRSFEAALEDKFLVAATGLSASELVLRRADHDAPGMGMTTFAGDLPAVDEARIGRNYLDRDELYALHLLCEQFLLFTESQALRGRRLTMAELAAKLDALLALNDYPVFRGYKGHLEARANRHAQAEYAQFVMRHGTRVTGRRR